MTFSIVTFTDGDRTSIGVLARDKIADASAVLSPLLGDAPAMLGVLERWDKALPLLEQLCDDLTAERVAALPLDETRLLAPLPRPVNLYCAFAN